jgi:anti-anti-sigma regulatory factor
VSVDQLTIDRSSAGPYITVLTLSGPVDEGAEHPLREQLASPELASQKVVLDLTEAVLFDSGLFPLLTEQAQRFDADRGGIAVVSGNNPTVSPFKGDPSLPGLEWFASLEDAMVELLGDMAKLGEWSPAAGRS